METKISKSGLTSFEAKNRLKKFGLNELRKTKEFTSLKILLDQFKSPLIYILLFAGIVTLFLRDFADSIIIFAAVAINTILGFCQEQKAQKSLQALKSLLASKAKVIREGFQQVINARKVVPGDLVVLTIGDRVPADGILVEATNLSVNEATLTGESMPVTKTAIENRKMDNTETRGFKKAQKENRLYMGSIIVTGIAKMLVTKTGMKTEMGKIGKRITELEEEKTPLQIEIGKLAKILAIVVGVFTLLIFLFGEFLGYHFLEIFTISVAVAVAAIPEGLAVSLTVILALGMQRILKQKAIVRKLLAAETLGSVSVICADKTGTLTEGKMRVVKADFTDFGLGVKAAILCNDLRDPLEVAMLDWAKQQLSSQTIEQLSKDYPRLSEIPFSPKYKYIATLHPSLLFLSGAPEVILKRCKIYDLRSKNKWLKKFEELGEKGYRLVGFAYKKIDHQSLTINHQDLSGLEWLGILVYEDPIRAGVREALERCQQAGIEVKVITGDYPATAKAVLNKLKIKNSKLKITSQNPKLKEIIKDGVITGEELEKISEEELEQIIGGVVLFARATPEQKLKIIKALKKKGEVVAMMGDGVNDAPALKQADIGIVVNEASDVARETSDMVLLDSNFATIVHAVEEGRAIFENIKKVTLYLLSCTFTEIILIGGSLLFRLPLPLTAGQILWINLVQDSFPAMALAFEPKEKELMEEPPRPKKTPILDKPMRILIFIVGVITDLVLFSLLIASWKGFLPFYFSQTMVFVGLGIISLFILFACRSLRRTIFRYNPLGNPLLIGSVLISSALLFAAIYFSPLKILLKTDFLGSREWTFIVGLGIFNLLAIELAKWIFIVRKNKLHSLIK